MPKGVWTDGPAKGKDKQKYTRKGDLRPSYIINEKGKVVRKPRKKDPKRFIPAEAKDATEALKYESVALTEAGQPRKRAKKYGLKTALDQLVQAGVYPEHYKEEDIRIDPAGFALTEQERPGLEKYAKKIGYKGPLPELFGSSHDPYAVAEKRLGSKIYHTHLGAQYEKNYIELTDGTRRQVNDLEFKHVHQKGLTSTGEKATPVGQKLGYVPKKEFISQSGDFTKTELFKYMRERQGIAGGVADHKKNIEYMKSQEGKFKKQFSQETKIKQPISTFKEYRQHKAKYRLGGGSSGTYQGAVFDKKHRDWLDAHPEYDDDAPETFIGKVKLIGFRGTYFYGEDDPNIYNEDADIIGKVEGGNLIIDKKWDFVYGKSMPLSKVMGYKKRTSGGAPAPIARPKPKGLIEKYKYKKGKGPASQFKSNLMGNMLGTIQESPVAMATGGGAPAPVKKKRYRIYKEGYAPTYALPGGIKENRHETEASALASAKKYPHRVKAIVKRKVRGKVVYETRATPTIKPSKTGEKTFLINV